MLNANEKTLDVLRRAGMDMDKYQRHFDRNEFQKELNSCVAKIEASGDWKFAEEVARFGIIVLGMNF